MYKSCIDCSGFSAKTKQVPNPQFICFHYSAFKTRFVCFSLMLFALQSVAMYHLSFTRFFPGAITNSFGDAQENTLLCIAIHEFIYLFRGVRQYSLEYFAPFFHCSLFSAFLTQMRSRTKVNM